VINDFTIALNVDLASAKCRLNSQVSCRTVNRTDSHPCLILPFGQLRRPIAPFALSRFVGWRSESMRCFLWAGGLRRCVCFLPPGSPLDIDSPHSEMHYAVVVSLPATTFNLGMAGPLDGLLQLRIPNHEASSARSIAVALAGM